MAKRKVSHHRRIISKTPTTMGAVGLGDIIEFTYSGDDIYDKKPLVFVLKKIGKFLDGINIGYMKEYKVKKLLQEKDLKRLKNYSLYKDSLRTYTKSKIQFIKSVEYETKEEQRKSNRREVKTKLDENKL